MYVRVAKFIRTQNLALSLPVNEIFEFLAVRKRLKIIESIES